MSHLRRSLWLPVAALLIALLTHGFLTRSVEAAVPLHSNETTRSSEPLDGLTEPIRRAKPRYGFSLLASGPVGLTGTVALPNIQSETTVAASGSNVVIGFNDFRGFAASPVSLSGYMYSTDGGNTFSDGGQLPVPLGGRVSGDPVLAVYEPPTGPTVFYYSSIYSPPSGATSLSIHSSTDGGQTWAGPFEVTSSSSFTDQLQDKEWCTVDPETGRLFVCWSRFPATGSTQMRVTYSDDGGLTWSPSVQVGTAGQGSVIACDPNGMNIYMAWRENQGDGIQSIRLARSLDNGATWLGSVLLSPTFFMALPAYGLDRFNSFPSLEVNPVDGGVELVYAASVNASPANDFGDIFYRRSVDAGVTFSAPVAVNTFPGADRPQIFPTVSVAGDGRIDLFWYDQSAGSGVSDLTDQFYSFSSDFGASWSSPVPLTPAPFANEVGNNFGAPHQGDYNDAFSSNPAYTAFAWFGEPSPFGTGADALGAAIASPSEVAALRVRPGTVTIVDFGCNADDGVLVAGEAASLTLPLQNFGRSTLFSVSATLTSLTGGVTVQGAHGSYGSIAAGGSANAMYGIRVSEAYACGEPARFRLDISAAGVVPTFVEFSLPTGVVVADTLLLAEDFDGVIAPALPAGWSAVNGCASCALSPWITTTSVPASGPNAAFCPNAATTTFSRMFGPAVMVPPGVAQVEVSFDIQYDLEQNDARIAFDAASFGYQLDGSGGTRFSTSDAIEYEHRYTHYVVRASGNGVGDRSGWSGNSGGYRHVRLVIPELAGHSLTPRFDLTTDANTAATGVWVDNFEVRGKTLGCGPCTPAVAVSEDPLRFSFQLAGPHPSRGGVALRYTLAERARVRIEVFDIAGKRVRTLIDAMEDPGGHRTDFRLAGPGGRALPPGVYLVRIVAGSHSRTLRIVGLE